MDEAIKTGDLEELERNLLHNATISNPTIKLAASKLASEPRSEECKRAVELLLEYGWSVNKPVDTEKQSLLCLLIGDFELVGWLLRQGADPNVILPDGNTPLSLAVARSSFETVKLLARHYGDFGVGELVYCAVEQRRSDVLWFLIRAGAPVDEILWDRKPAYQTKAHFTRGTALHRACELRYPEIVDILIKAGASPHKKKSRYHSPHGETPYEFAQRAGYADVLEVLRR